MAETSSRQPLFSHVKFADGNYVATDWTDRKTVDEWNATHHQRGGVTHVGIAGAYRPVQDALSSSSER